MLNMGLIFVFDIYGADEVSLGVFDNNKQAYNCYKSVGFRENGVREEYNLCGETWIDIDMVIRKVIMETISDGKMKKTFFLKRRTGMNRGFIGILLLIMFTCILVLGCYTNGGMNGPEKTSENVNISDTNKGDATKEKLVAEAGQNGDSDTDNSLISSYHVFDIQSENLKDGKWDDVISNTDKGENRSPQLSWEPAEDASSYAIYMVDSSAQYWMHWKSSDIHETNLTEGYADTKEYIGPYPPEGSTHTYEIYVFALKNPVERLKGGFNSQNPKFPAFVEALDTDEDGLPGNILGVAHISGEFSN